MTEPTLFINLRKVITLIDRLRDIGLQKYISLPRICVVGTQSSGKSSLLEQIVGMDFLPRAAGVCTRRPLELRLVNTSKENLPKPKAKFDEIPDTEFTDFQIVKKKIDELTDKVAGNKKEIVDKPIQLTIYSNTCPDLTLIDLPGITRIPIAGQPENIEEITKNMCKRYASDESTVILCVIPANQDISTSDGLMLARNCDPNGKRTIGVLTKIDIMDKGVNAKSLLLGQEISLRLGYVGVICRSQDDINKNKQVSVHLADEQKFFSGHPVYSTLRKGSVGTESLIRTLTEVLYTHIRSFLPELQKLIQAQIKFKENRLKELGPSLPESEAEKMKFLWQTINDFIIQFKNTIQGTYSKENARRDEIPAGAKIRIVLQELYSDFIDNKICNKYKDDDIKRAIMLHEGHSIPGFPSIDAFMALLIPKLKDMKAPAQEVYQILDNIARKIMKRVCEKVPELLNDLQEKIIQHLQHEKEKTSKLIDNLIDSEIGYVFTNDVEYLGERGKVQKQQQNTILDTSKEQKGGGDIIQKKIEEQQQQQSGNPLVQELRNRIDDYFSVVLRGLRDTIPKLVGNFLVRASHEKMRYVLFEAIRQSKELFQLMQEPKHIIEERKELKKAVETLKESKEMIKKDPDLSLMSNQVLAEEIDNKFPQKKEALKKQQPDQGQQQQQQDKQQQQIIKKEQSLEEKKQNQTGGGMKGLFGIEDNDLKNKNAQQQQQNSNIQPQKQTVQQPQQNANQQKPPEEKKTQPNIIQNNNNNNSTNNNQVNQNQNQNNNANNQNNTNGNNNNNNQKQQPIEKVNKKFDMFGTGGTTGITDKLVDNAMSNPQVQKGMQDAAKNATQKIIEEKIPITNKDGKNIIAEKGAEFAGKAIQNESVQNAIKDGAKKGLQEGIQEAKKPGGLKW